MSKLRDKITRAVMLAWAQNPPTYEEVPTQLCPDDYDGTTKMVRTYHLNPIIDAVMAVIEPND